GTWDESKTLWRYKNGALVQSITTIGNHNKWRVGANGHVGYGYYGDSWLWFPDGRQERVNLVDESPPLPFYYRNELWLSSVTDEYVIIRPYGDTQAILLKSPTDCVYHDLRVVGDRFIVAAQDVKGRLYVW